MQRFLLLALIFAFCVFSCQSPAYIPPQTASMTSQYNKGYKDGLVEGKVLGEKKGYIDGYKIGRSEGLYTGKLLGADSILQVMKEVNWDKYAILITMNNNCYQPYVDAYEDARLTGFEKGLYQGEADAYERGYKDGHEESFRIVNSINLAKGETVNYPSEKNSHLAIDYEKVAQLLNQIGSSENYVNLAQFSSALREIHLEVIGYLSRRLNSELSPVEQSEAFQRYEEIHERLALSYYNRYISLCNTRNRNYNQRSFFDYRHHSSADIFLDVVGLGLSGVLDAVYTYAKSNPQFCATSGFEVMGHISELVIDEILLPVYDLLIKQAIRLDYEEKIPVLQASAQNIISPMVAHYRTHTKTVTEKIEKGDDFSEVKMEIVTIVALGFSQDLELNVSHPQQRFTMNMSNIPRYLYTVSQDYKVLSVETHTKIPYPGGKECFKVSPSDLKKIFEANKDDPETLSICTKPLSMKELEAVIPMFIKVLEPAISLPAGCYHAKVNFDGHLPKEIVSANCR